MLLSLFQNFCAFVGFFAKKTIKKLKQTLHHRVRPSTKIISHMIRLMLNIISLCRVFWMSLAYWKAYPHLVQTGHVSSRWWTLGRHGREPQFPSTWYSKAPFWSELLSVMNILLVFVNTEVILLVRMIVICSHQVPIILLGPSRWTVILCWDH